MSVVFKPSCKIKSSIYFVLNLSIKLYHFLEKELRICFIINLSSFETTPTLDSFFNILSGIISSKLSKNKETSPTRAFIFLFSCIILSCQSSIRLCANRFSILKTLFNLSSCFFIFVSCNLLFPNNCQYR